MDNFFKQERLELDLFYIQNVFSSNRYFNFSESFEQNNILYAKNTKNNSNLTSILERELHIRKIIKKYFKNTLIKKILDSIINYIMILYGAMEKGTKDIMNILESYINQTMGI